jgi:L-ribulose-5-phosphate 3-epimerase
MTITRRNFVKSVAAASVVIPLNGLSDHFIENRLSYNCEKGKICAFSKPFQFLDYDQLSEVFAAAGLDGIDLTVRPGGHVEPERVKTDLPKAVSAARKNGLEITMIVTAIMDADNKTNQEILKTAADLGVNCYRTDYLNYDYSLTIPENMDNARRTFGKLAVLNEKTGINGAYQNHSGMPRIGRGVWDLWYILKDMDTQWMSCQHDILHAVVEGWTSWSDSLRLLSPYIKTRCVKDFIWADQNGKRSPDPVPLGDGLIDFDAYFKILKGLNIKTDTTVHIEYPVLLNDEINLPAKKKIEKAIAVLKSDTNKLKTMMARNGFI